MFRKSNANKRVQFFLASLKYREIITVKTVTFYKKLYSLKVLKARKRSYEEVIMSVQKYGWVIRTSLFL